MIQPGQIVKVRFQDTRSAGLVKWVVGEVYRFRTPIDSVEVLVDLGSGKKAVKVDESSLLVKDGRVFRRVHPSDIEEVK